MKPEPLVSIITPMYNAEQYIQETIQSVLNQSYKNWEMIIVNNCSTDRSSEIVNSIDENRIRLIDLEYNSGGPARPRNVGVENAKGEYIAFLDSDDVWLPQKLEKQITFLEDNKDVDICHTLANIIDEKSIYQGFFNNQKSYNILKYIISSKNILFYTNNININSVLMRIDKSIKFNDEKTMIAVEDWGYWIENQSQGKNIQLLKDILVNYRIHSDSITSKDKSKIYRRSLYFLTQKFVKDEIQHVHYFFSTLLNNLKILKNR
ncbi:glycosyltransferase family 2 protein [Arcobacter sp.]|uniref:glycosyltransferase family 2 protein n=1 Tax=Arcobacter sp. TaxID=1872629 RepID=UPI003D0AB5B1